MKHKNIVKFIDYSNMLFPLFGGCVLYIVLRKDLFPPKLLEIRFINALQAKLYIDFQPDSLIENIVAYQLTDFLWAYSLTWAVLLSSKNEKRDIVLCAIYCTLVEIIQIFPVFLSTFDYWDIIAQLFAIIIGTVFYHKSRKQFT